jgi:superfamily I DNA and/or RNA helicase
MQNEKEIQGMVFLTDVLQRTGKSFRIITPYDAQRTRIENALKAAGLKWEDKVFNVDSFQVRRIGYTCVSPAN